MRSRVLPGMGMGMGMGMGIGIGIGSLLALCLLLGGAAGAQPAEQKRPEIIKLSLLIDGSVREVTTHLYKPEGAGPFPLVIFSHGRAAARARSGGRGAGRTAPRRPGGRGR